MTTVEKLEAIGRTCEWVRTAMSGPEWVVQSIDLEGKGVEGRGDTLEAAVDLLHQRLLDSAEQLRKKHEAAVREANLKSRQLAGEETT